MITEDYVSFEIAKLLKEKGFNEPCNNRYYETHSGFDIGLDPGYTNSHWEDWYKDLGVRNYSAPTIQMTMKWLREVHNISIESLVDFGSGDEYWWTADIAYIKKDGLIDELCGYNTYEESCEAAIKYCLENLI